MWDAHFDGGAPLLRASAQRKASGPTEACRPTARAKNTTLVASLSLGGIGAAMTFEGATTKVVFETYDVEEVLAPTMLEPEQIVVMDNLGAHTKGVGSKR